MKLYHDRYASWITTMGKAIPWPVVVMLMLMLEEGETDTAVTMVNRVLAV